MGFLVRAYRTQEGQLVFLAWCCPGSRIHICGLSSWGLKGKEEVTQIRKVHTWFGQHSTLGVALKCLLRNQGQP